MTIQEKFSQERRMTSIHVGVALFALFVGTLYGPLQALEHAGVDLYFMAPWTKSYYHGLTLHGVLNALVFTTFFICGLLTYSTVYTLDRTLQPRWVGWVGLGTMIFGLLMAAVPLLNNQATVLFTFYPPLKAHWAFYVGATLLVVGSWVCGVSMYLTLASWYKDNPGERAPLLALMSCITMAMWQIASLGLAVESLFLLIPWSTGLIDEIDPQLARTLFWFTGHPIVYFWLLPAYMSWYVMLPKQAGGKLFSDPMARLSFFIFLALSTPLGFHHQYTDPGIAAGWKYFHGVLTFGVFFPSLLTAYNTWASLFIAGRSNGGGKNLSWILKLPWGNPSVTAQLLAMILFLFGGIGGLINASYNMNLVVHNTAWVAGHFHLTVGSAVALSFMGISYWLIPHLSGRQLISDKLGLSHAITWFVGMIFMSRGLHLMGLLGAPRRTSMGAAIKADVFNNPDWNVPLVFVGLGGVILMVSYLLFYATILGTLFFGKKLADDEIPEFPIADSVSRPENGPMWLSQWRPWLAATIVLVLIGYGPVLMAYMMKTQWNAPGFQPW